MVGAACSYRPISVMTTFSKGGKKTKNSILKGKRVLTVPDFAVRFPASTIFVFFLSPVLKLVFCFLFFCFYPF